MGKLNINNVRIEVAVRKVLSFRRTAGRSRQITKSYARQVFHCLELVTAKHGHQQSDVWWVELRMGTWQFTAGVHGDWSVSNRHGIGRMVLGRATRDISEPSTWSQDVQWEHGKLRVINGTQKRRLWLNLRLLTSFMFSQMHSIVWQCHMSSTTTL